MIYSVGLQDMGFYTQQFTTRYPQAKIRLAYLHPHEVVDAVINDEADLGILSFPTPHRSLTIDSVALGADGLCMSSNSRVGEEANDFRARSVGREVRCLRKEPADHGKRSTRHCGSVADTSKHAMEFDNIETIKQAITIQFRSQYPAAAQHFT